MTTMSHHNSSVKNVSSLKPLPSISLPAFQRKPPPRTPEPLECCLLFSVWIRKLVELEIKAKRRNLRPWLETLAPRETLRVTCQERDILTVLITVKRCRWLILLYEGSLEMVEKHSETIWRHKWQIDLAYCGSYAGTAKFKFHVPACRKVCVSSQWTPATFLNWILSIIGEFTDSSWYVPRSLAYEMIAPHDLFQYRVTSYSQTLFP